MAVWVAAVVGLVAGYVVSIPPTGPVALLELRSTVLGHHRYAVLLSIGSAVTDIPYVLLGALGFSWIVGTDPVTSAGFDALGALILGVVGAKLLGDARIVPIARAEDPDRGRSLAPLLHGAALGLANPTRMLTWAVVASVVAPVLSAATLQAWGAFALGVAVGEVVWSITQVVAWRWFGERLRGGPERWLLGIGAVLAFVSAGSLVIGAVRKVVGGA